MGTMAVDMSAVDFVAVAEDTPVVTGVGTDNGRTSSQHPR